ncbi:MAG: hypothetical protein Q8R20_03585 [Nanoarchaeota archaeon]|nr:hypothetical protein [Nanoarchaeota archaeon]
MRNHNNNNKDGGHKGMMLMMIPCLLLLGILFLGEGKLSSSEYIWPILIGVFVVAHIWIMFRGYGRHGKHSDTDTGGEKDKHQHGDRCH